MTKTEVKKLDVESLRELLAEHFEGITEDQTKTELQQIVDDNWEFLDGVLNPDEGLDLSEGEEDSEESEEEEFNPEKPNPATDLYSGTMRG